MECYWRTSWSIWIIFLDMRFITAHFPPTSLTNKLKHGSIHHHTRTIGDFKGWRGLWQKPAGGEMFYKLILLSWSLFLNTWLHLAGGRERERESHGRIHLGREHSFTPCMCCLHLSVRLPSAVQHRPYLYWHSSLPFQAAKACMT